MDPFIEGCGLWEDFHTHFVEKIGEALAGLVPDNYLVRTGLRAYVVLVDDDRQKSHSFKPDASITTDRSSAADAATAVAEPELGSALSMRALVEEEFRERFVEIHEADGERRLVTGIEVLSPSNKKRNSPGWDQYLRKRQGFFASRSANFIELDLLRGGELMPMADAWPDSPYRLVVARLQRMPMCQVWQAHFQRPLPSIPVPLFPPDPEVQLELQPMIDAIYSRWRYYRSIDYRTPLAPPLSAEETAWLAQQLRQRTAPA
jgi:Protein of unknown function (DUF4058)